MIESCNTKRMLIGIGLLGGLTFLVLIVESQWANQNTHHPSTNTSTKSGECWTHENYEVVEPCHPCTSFEIASQSIEACLATHFKDVVKCEISGRVQRSCEKVTWIEEKKFWIFEAVMFTIAVLSGSIVYIRQHILDRRVKARIQKQLANGLAN